MPDYIYLLENRLSLAQQNALTSVREAAREEGMTVFLVGGAVRDLTSGSSVRDLDFALQGNALALKQRLLSGGATLWGEHTSSQTLFFRFPGSVRVEVASARREEFPKPGKPVYEWASILEDLRRRDFTVNAMAISLNEGSYGLLMDPTNGVADIDSRTLRLVNNYGFLEDPIRLVRATRFSARLGWQMDERTQVRFDNAREEGVISAISPWQKGYEAEEIGHEENPLEILRALEAAGWMNVLCRAWTSAKADVQGLEQMHEVLTRLQMQGVHPDPSTAAMELLTAHMPAKDIEGLKKSFVRPGFVTEWNRLNADAEEFARQLTAREMVSPSATWKLFMHANPEAVLWLGLTGKSAAIQNKFKNFFNVWPAARQKVPTALMLEMRITPDLPQYPELLEELFYRTIDGELETEEQMRAFLEPYSPPAPAPQTPVRRSRSKKAAEKKQAAVEAEPAATPEPEAEGETEDLSGMVEQPGQEEQAIRTAEIDIPAVGETAPPGKTPVVGVKAKQRAPKKKPEPEAKAEVKEVPTPVQAASRMAGTQIANGGAPAAVKTPAARTTSAKPVPKPAPAKASAKAVPAKAAHKPAPKPAAKAALKATPAPKSAAHKGTVKAAARKSAQAKVSPGASSNRAGSKAAAGNSGKQHVPAKKPAGKAAPAPARKAGGMSAPAPRSGAAAKGPAKGAKAAPGKKAAAKRR